LSKIALQEASPILAVFFACSGDAAQAWLDLDFSVGAVSGSDVISKVIVQKTEEGCAVVVHSTADFAVLNTGVYGSSSSAARVGDASSDSSREDLLITELLAGLHQLPGIPTVGNCDYGPLLHRWGNAFPKGEALPENLSMCTSSRVVFCGDYTETGAGARLGSVEAALLSGTNAGEKIVQEAQKQCSL
jgi:hypothetical protein